MLLGGESKATINVDDDDVGGSHTGKGRMVYESASLDGGGGGKEFHVQGREGRDAKKEMALEELDCP